MASALYRQTEQDPTDLGPIEPPHLVELGPGTGRITAHLNTQPLTLVEIDTTFCQLLANRFAHAQVLNMSAIDFLLQQKTPIDVVTSIPLLNNPQSRAIKSAISQAYQAGVIRRLVTYSYGPLSPLGSCGFASQKRVDHVLRNIPPATVWVYQ
jgi:phospholipid N-methyltransferase